MSLKTAMQQAATAAFSATKDLQQEISFQSRSETYSAATGAVTDSGTAYTLKALFSRYKDSERLNGGDILIDDYRVLFPAKSLSFSPKNQDVITVGSDTYEVLAVVLDTAQAMYSLQVRKQ